MTQCTDRQPCPVLNVMYEGEARHSWRVPRRRQQYGRVACRQHLAVDAPRVLRHLIARMQRCYGDHVVPRSFHEVECARAAQHAHVDCRLLGGAILRYVLGNRLHQVQLARLRGQNARGLLDAPVGLNGDAVHHAFGVVADVTYLTRTAR